MHGLINKGHISQVHLPLPVNVINPRESSYRAFPMVEMDMDVNHINYMPTIIKRIKAIHDIIDWLDVENSPRYTSQDGLTYCNIYAYDLTYYLGCYLPRVWWHEDAVQQILNGKPIEVIYGKSVFEQNCNSLYNWFEKYGALFSWKQCHDLQTMQQVVNNGGHLGVIIAQHRDLFLSGHIAIVIPEKGKKQKKEIYTPIPLQTQAGVINKKYFKDCWWEVPGKFGGVAGWVCYI